MWVHWQVSLFARERNITKISLGTKKQVIFNNINPYEEIGVIAIVDCLVKNCFYSQILIKLR
jgi:hypothetical protein